MGDKEDLKNVRMGKLPVGELTQIIAAPGFKACFKTDDGEEHSPLVAWAFLKDGTLVPLMYNKISRSYISAYVVTGFVEITHEDFLEEEEEDPF